MLCIAGSCLPQDLMCLLSWYSIRIIVLQTIDIFYYWLVLLFFFCNYLSAYLFFPALFSLSIFQVFFPSHPTDSASCQQWRMWDLHLLGTQTTFLSLVVTKIIDSILIYCYLASLKFVSANGVVAHWYAHVLSCIRLEFNSH